MAKKEKDLAKFDSKKMLADAGEKGIKFRYTDRKKVEIIKATKHYKVGEINEPHVVKADALITQGIAKEYKEPKN